MNAGHGPTQSRVNFESIELLQDNMSILRRFARYVLPASWRPQRRFERRLLAVSGGQVLSGPFNEMRYINSSVGSVLPPKLMGTYELELHTVIGRLETLAPTQPIVVGAAEGYYAVGMAKWPSVVSLTAFEAVCEAHDTIRELARINGVEEKIITLGLCDCSLLNKALEACLDKHPVLIVDIEGGEGILLDPTVVPRLRDSIMLVEMHDAFVPGLAERLKERFSRTHRIERIDAVSRKPSDLPEKLHPLPAFTARAAVFALEEGRFPNMYWWLLIPVNAREFI